MLAERGLIGWRAHTTTEGGKNCISTLSGAVYVSPHAPAVPAIFRTVDRLLFTVFSEDPRMITVGMSSALYSYGGKRTEGLVPYMPAVVRRAHN